MGTPNESWMDLHRLAASLEEEGLTQQERLDNLVHEVLGDAAAGSAGAIARAALCIVRADRPGAGGDSSNECGRGEQEVAAEDGVNVG